MKFLPATYRLWATGIGCVFVAAVLLVWNVEHRQEEAHRQQILIAESDALVNTARLHFEQLQLAARSVRWFVENTQVPSQSAYRDYLLTMQISPQDLGAQGIAIAAHVPAEKLGEHQRQMRAQGRSDYAVKPQTRQDFHAPLVLIEPDSPSNRDALGFDVASNPNAIEALLASRDSGQYLLSERLQLVQDAGKPQTPSFVLYAPIFQREARPSTVDERRGAIRAWVSIPFRTQDFFDRLLKSRALSIPFCVVEASPTGNGAVLYRSPLMQQDGAQPLRMLQRRPLSLGGKEWTLEFFQPAATESFLGLLALDWIALFGLTAGIFVGVLLWRLGASRQMAKEDARQALDAQSQALENHRSLLEALPDLMFELDAQGYFHQFRGPRQDLLYANPAFFLGKRLQQVLPPEVAEVCMGALCEAARNGHASGQEISLEIGGEVRWFELSTALKSPLAADKRFVMLSREVTPRKRAQLKLQQSEERLRLAVQGGNVGLWEWTFANGQLQVNDEWCHMLGIAPGTESVDMDLWTSLVHPDDFIRLEQVVREVVLNPKGREFSLEIRARHQRGHYVWILDRGAVLERDANAIPVRVLGSHLDISAQKEVSERLRVSAHALMASTQGIMISDRAGINISVNPAFCKMCGYSEKEMLGSNCRKLQGPDTDAAQIQRIRHAIETGTEFSGDVLNYRKDGTTYWDELLITPLREGDVLTHFIGVSRDVTEKKLAARQLEQDRQALLESRTELRNLSRRLQAAQEIERRRVAHELHDELGQTLTALKINLQASGRLPDLEPGKALEGNVRIVDQAIAQVRQLSLALRPSMLDDLGLPAALRWLASSSAAQQDLEVKFEYQADRERLPPDTETACFRIVQEALTNVRRHAQATQVLIDLLVARGHLQLRIADNGRGFDASRLAQRSAEYPSLGILGMRERAVSIGASIEFDSQPGQGCRVLLRCDLGERSWESR